MRIEGLCKSFGDNIIFDNYDLDIQDGKCTVITGVSGCGKTTLLRILAGLEEYKCTFEDRKSQKVSYVFQEDRLCDNLTAIDNVMLVIRHGRNKKADRRKCEECLTELGLDNAIYKRASELSGGMKRRVAIARAVMSDADMFLMDEPFTGLDMDCKEVVMKYLKKVLNGKTMVLTTHDSSERDYFADNIIEL